jgi:hypothetical protein
MNALNDNNDPFEDIFRDRFADFESEPSEILWNKIEPQLPVNTTRRFPYWQISAVAIILLLAGLWSYREKYSEGNITQSDDSQTVSKTKSDNNSIQRELPSETRLTEVNPIQNNESKDLIVNDLSKNKINKSEEKIHIEKLPNKFSQDKNETFVFGEKEDIRVIQEVTYKKSSLFPKPHTTFELPAASLNKTIDFNSKNNKNQLNLFSFNNSNEEKETIVEKPSNDLSVSSVFSDKENITVLNKKSLTSLESRSCGLLANHFKTVKLKFVNVPKEESYFKEKKPLEFYASAMPLLNYYTITPNGNDANFVHNISVNDDGDRVGFYTQAGLVFTLSDKFKLRTGLTFTKTNHSISYRVRTDSLVVQPADNKGVDISFADLNKTYSQSANYLGTKIEVQYAFLQGEALTHYVSIGGEAAYRLNGNHELNGFANFAYGITRQIGDNAYIFIEPTFSYSLNQQSDNNSLLLVKPNKIGFNIGVNFKIK